jgi:hypothetical protein
VVIAQKGVVSPINNTSSKGLLSYFFFKIKFPALIVSFAQSLFQNSDAKKAMSPRKSKSRAEELTHRQAGRPEDLCWQRQPCLA